MKYTFTAERLLSGKYVVRILIDERNTMFFKFNDVPSLEVVQAVVDNYLNLIENQVSQNIQNPLQEKIKEIEELKLENKRLLDEIDKMTKGKVK